MKKRIIKILLIIVLCSVTIPIGHGVEQYHHAFTIKSPNPSNHAWFGYKVKIDDDIIVITEPYADVNDIPDAGKVYVYDEEGSLVNTLQSPTPGNVFNFGFRLDLFQDTLIIKDRYASVDNLEWAGKAHVFTTNGTYQITLQSPEPQARYSFGTPGIYEDLFVFYERTGEGRVHLFDNGEYLKTIYSPTSKVGRFFGRTIEVSENHILLGEYGSGDLPNGPGSVYVYNHDGDHIMILQAPLPEEHASFGTSISVSGEWMVIGESDATVDGIRKAGRVHIFNTDGEHLRTLHSPILKTGGEFGCSVAIDGETVVVGERFANINPFHYEGRAYVFDINGNLLQNLTAPDPCPRAAFGDDVDIKGDTIVVGEGWASTEELGQAGRAHVFRFGEVIFEYSNLVIEPESVGLGESVSIFVDVENVGTLFGTHSVKLMIDGEMVEEKTVAVDVGLSERINFSYETDIAGSYSVEIEDLEGTFKVKKPIILGFPIIALGLGLMFTIILSLQRKR